MNLFAGGNVLPTTIAMLDSDPAELPGLFSSVQSLGPGAVTDGLLYAFPDVEPDTSELTLEEEHNQTPTHANDFEPVRIYADGDIGDSAEGVSLFVPKQARIFAGQDIVNMVFFGQNLAPSDITRIVAGRDITATTELETPVTSVTAGSGQSTAPTATFGVPEPALLGNTFTLGGPGEFMLEAGRNMGPFLNSADVTQGEETSTGVENPNLSFGGGVITIGNGDNPFLAPTGASIDVLFGVANGADFDALRDDYVAPGTAANALGGYSATLITWMQQNQAQTLLADFGTTDVSADQAYSAFLGLPELNQEIFLLADVYFNELAAPADPTGPSFQQFTRGYEAVNTLFPASLGYTANNLSGGTNGANQMVHTGNLDLRLATLETQEGGDVRILGPGGNVLAGSVVSTSVQAARRSFLGFQLFGGNAIAADLTAFPEAINSIPTGSEGVLTLRGGNIDTFTDGDFLVNQSRVFTEEGGNIVMWSSNADLNAGQGAKTTASFPPIVVQTDDDAFTTVDVLGGVTGAGIATLQATPESPKGDIFLLAPRGTVDAGDAGIRVSGNISIAALHVLNADNIQVGGQAFGIPTVVAPNIGALTSAGNAAGAAAQAAEQAGRRPNSQSQPSVFIIEILGYGGGDGIDDQQQQENKKKLDATQASYEAQDPQSRYQVVGLGDVTNAQAIEMAYSRRAEIGQLAP